MCLGPGLRGRARPGCSSSRWPRQIHERAALNGGAQAVATSKSQSLRAMARPHIKLATAEPLARPILLLDTAQWDQTKGRGDNSPMAKRAFSFSRRRRPRAGCIELNWSPQAAHSPSGSVAGQSGAGLHFIRLCLCAQVKWAPDRRKRAPEPSRRGALE